jgi:hypothetical protein
MARLGLKDLLQSSNRMFGAIQTTLVAIYRSLFNPQPLAIASSEPAIPEEDVRSLTPRPIKLPKLSPVEHEANRYNLRKRQTVSYKEEDEIFE